MANALNCCLRGGRALTINKFRDANTLELKVQTFHFGGWRAMASTNNQVREMKKLAFPVDTLAVVRRLEGQNIPSHQAEAIAHAIKEVIDDGLRRSLTLFATKEQLKMSEMIQSENQAEFRYEIIRAKENHFTSIKHQIEEIKVEDKNKKAQLSCQINDDAMEHSLELQRQKQYIQDELSKQINEMYDVFHQLKIRFKDFDGSFEGN